MPQHWSGEREAPATGVLELTLDLLLELLGVHDRPQPPLQGGEALKRHEPTPPHGPPRWRCCAPGTSTTSRAASSPVGAASGRPCREGAGFGHSPSPCGLPGVEAVQAHGTAPPRRGPAPAAGEEPGERAELAPGA